MMTAMTVEELVRRQHAERRAALKAKGAIFNDQLEWFLNAELNERLSQIEPIQTWVDSQQSTKH